jgi:hypothetical protein
LSAAPRFGRHREFLGYRGFGVLGEEIEAVAVSESDGLAELADNDQPTLPEAFEPEPSWPATELQSEVQAAESAAAPVEPELEPATIDAPDAQPFDASHKAY